MNAVTLRPVSTENAKTLAHTRHVVSMPTVPHMSTNQSVPAGLVMMGILMISVVNQNAELILTVPLHWLVGMRNVLILVIVLPMPFVMQEIIEATVPASLAILVIPTQEVAIQVKIHYIFELNRFLKKYFCPCSSQACAN